MKTSYIVVLGVGIATAVILSVGAVYGMTRWTAPQQGVYPSGMMSGSAYGGTTVGSPTYRSGMMGGYGGVSGGYGGMMGGSGGMMGGYGYGSGSTGSPSAYWGGMMGGRGGMMGGYGGMMSQYANYMWNRTAYGAFVTIFNNGFYPSILTISKGTTVTWVNMDFVQHTVTAGSEQAPTGLFDSHELNHMQSFSYTFSNPGTYTYYCDVHPSMIGTITVTR